MPDNIPISPLPIVDQLKQNGPISSPETYNSVYNNLPDTHVDIQQQILDHFQDPGSSENNPSNIYKFNPNLINTRYNKQIIGADNEELYHEGQSTWNRLGNAGVNLLGKTLAYLTQGAGFILGTPAAIAGWDITNMTDNFLVRAGEALKENVQDSNPIYKGDAYTNGNIWQKLTTSDWWLDDAIDRLALTASMVVPGFAETRGLSLFGTLAEEGGGLRATGLLSRGIQAVADNPESYSGLIKTAAWTDNAVSKLKSAFTGEDYSQLGKSFISKLSKATAGEVDSGLTPAFKNYAQGLTKAELYSWNIIGQSGLNAKEAYDGIRKSLIEQRDAGVSQLTDDEIDQKAKEGAMKGFWWTVPLSFVGSLVELPQMFNAAKDSRSALSKLFNPETGEAIEDALNPKNNILKTIGIALGTGFEHGQNESMQVAIGRYLEESIAGKRDEKTGEWKKDTRSTGVGIFQDFLDNVNDPNGQNNIALGTIQGILTSLGGKVWHRFNGAEAQERAQKQNLFNSIQEARANRRYFLADPTSFIEKNENGKYITDEKGNVKLNQQKLADAGISLKSSEDWLQEKANAIANGDYAYADYLNFANLKNFSYQFFSDKRGMDHLEALLRIEYLDAQKSKDTRQNDLDEFGNEITIDQQYQKNLDYVRKLKKAYDAIDQRHAGFMALPIENVAERKAANQFLQLHKGLQFDKAAEQIYYKDKLDKVNSSLNTIKLESGLLEQNETIKDPSNPSEERFNDLFQQKKDLEGLLEASKIAYKKSINKDQIRKAWDRQREFNNKVDRNEVAGKKYRSVTPEKEQDEFRGKLSSDKRTLEDIKSQYGEGVQSEQGVLNKIATSPYTTSEERDLAKKLHGKSSPDESIFLGNNNISTSGTQENGKTHINYEASAHDYEGGSVPIESSILNQLTKKYGGKGISQEEYNKKATDIEKRRKTTENSFHLEKDKNGKEYEYYIGPDGRTTQVYGEGEQEVKDKINAKYDEELRQLQEQQDIREHFISSQKINKEGLKNEQEAIDKAAEEISKMTSKEKQTLLSVAGDVVTPSPQELKDAVDTPKPRIERVKLKDIHNPNKENAFNKRHQNFLQVADALPYRDNLQQLIVTVNNEDSLGLTGLTAAFTKGSKYEGKEHDPQEGPIVKVMVLNEKGKHYFVNEKGEKIKGANKRYTQVGKQVDINSIVASVAPRAVMEYSDEFGNQINYSHAEEAEAKLWNEAWKEKRDEIFKWAGENYFPFNISRGSGAVREQDTDTKLSKRNPVVGSLLPEGSENLLNTVQNLVQVSTGTTHQFNGENINVQPGRPFFAYKSTFDFLNNRYLNKQEAETVFTVLKQITQEIKDGKGLNTKLRDFLNGIIYFAKPTNQDGEAKSLLQNNIFFEGPTWFFGKKSDTEAALQIPFTVDALEANKDQIISTIQGMFNNVNNHKLTQLKGQAYDEYFLDKNGNLQTRTWPNYQSYLIAAKNPDGSERDIPLTTNLAPQAKSPGGINYKYKYTWNPDLLQEPDMSSLQQKPEIKEEPKNETVGNIQQTKTESVENTQQNEAKEVAYTSKKEPISYSIQGQDLIIEKDESYQSILKRLMDAGNSEEASENAIQQTVINHIVSQQDNVKNSSQPKQEDVKNNLPDDDVFSTIRNWEYIKGNMEKEKTWIQKRFNLPVHVVENIIRKTDGGYAFGKLRDSAITLWEGAQQGTGYHEAFEAAWNIFSSDNEKTLLLGDFRRRKGSFIDDNGNEVEYKNASDLQAKEEMAEEFRHYVLNRQPKKQGRIGQFIQKLWNWIKDLFVDRTDFIKELFQKIDSGYYKSTSPLYAIRGGQYSTIPGLDAASTQRVIQGIATKIFQQFSKAAKEGKRSFTEFDLGEEVSVQEFFDTAFASVFKDLDSQGTTYAGVKNAITLGRKELEKQTKEYLKTLHLSIPDNEEDRESEEASYSRDESYLKDTFEWTGGRNAAASIRLMISTIIDTERVDENLKPKRDESTFMVKMVDSSKLWNQLYTELSILNTPEEKEQKVLELAKQFPAMQVLAQRLGLEKEAPTNDDFELRAKFFHTFSKQRPIALVQVKEDGNVFIKEMNQGDAIRRLTTDWLDREKWQQDSGLVEWQPNQNGESGIWALNQKKIESILPGEIRNLSSQLKVLSVLGIPSTKELWQNLSGKDKEKFNNYIASIYSILRTKDIKNAATPASLKLETPIRGLAQLYVKTSGEYPESTFVGLTGERRAEFIQGNTVSVWINDINNSSSLDELKQILPHLNQLWAKNNQYLSQDRFDVARNEKAPLFEVEYVQGTDNRDEDDKVETEKLTEGNRLLQEINLNLGGHFYTVLPADAKTEYTIKTTPVFGMQDIQSNEFVNKLQQVFNGYYEVEKQLYKEDKKERLLQPIVGDYSAKTISKEKIENWLKGLVQQQKQFLQEQKILKEYDKDGQTFYNFEGLNTDFTSKNKLNSEALTKEELNTVLSLRTVNYAINNIEMMKLFFGDPAAYGSTESILKRIKSFLSPREISVYNWDDFNSWANQHYNEGLEPGDFGYYTHKDFADTITLGTIDSYVDSIADDEHLPKEISVPYKKSDSTDGQGHATLPGYREMRIKRGHTWTSHDQALYEYLSARDRQFMYEDGKLTDATYRKELQDRDKKLVEKGPDTKGQLYALKPVGSGYTLTDDPFLDKDSIFPLTYAAVRKTALGDHYIEMVKRGMAYAIFDTGRKLGQGPIQEFYDKDGNAKTDYSNVVQIPYRYLGIQTETAGSKDSQTTGSQVSKYVTTNIYDGGVPTDYKGDLLSWIKLSEEERKKASPRHALAEHNREVREQMVEEGYQRLLRKLGIEQDGHNFDVDKEVVQKLLQNELLRRELPNNIKDALQVENGEWKVPLEALNNYREIKNVIYSYVQKYISKPKVNGAPAVQVSSGGIAAIGVKKSTINGKQAWVSSNLKFYGAKYKNGKIESVDRMQVYMSVPSQFIKMFPGKKAEEIFDIVKASKEGQDILSAVGFRIPTQEMNSVDAFEIAGFLPIGYVNTIVVPEALTTKAGSDFDVDKLNTYLKNFIINGKNEIEAVKYFDNREDSDKYYRQVFKETLERKISDAEKSIEKTGKLQDFFGKIAGGTVSQKTREKWAPIFHEMFPDMDSIDIEQEFIDKLERKGKQLERLTDMDFQETLLWEFLDKMYQKGLENEYFHSMEQLILHPDNYERLIKPNNADKSKEIADNLQKLAPGQFGSSVSSIMNPREMSRMRHLFLLAKQWVGMVAVHATGHTLTQKFPIILNPERLESLTKDEKDIVKSLNIALPHKTITLEDGKSYATISNGRSYTGTEKPGEYISDVISRRLDGTVDAVKNPWLSVIIQNTNMVGLHMLMDRLSVPEEISAYFLNQPIIRRYNELMDQRGEGEYESDVIRQLETEFPIDNKEGGKTVITKFPTQDVNKLSKHLQDNISRYYTDPESISHQDNAEQRFAFDGFLKYRVLARHLQKFNAATSYDTVSFTDMNMAEFKEAQTKDVESNNLFTSVEDILKKTFIGSIRDKVLEANQAISSSLFRFDAPQVRRYLAPVLNQMKQYIFGASNYLSAARKVEQSFIQYLIQNSGLNTRLYDLLVDPKTNIATKLASLKLKGDITDNPVIKALKVQGTASDTATKNVQLFSKAYDVFTSNIYTAALLELKYNTYTADFYKDLVDAAFLQAGITQQNNSFSDIIPNEDFKAKLEDAINQLNNPDMMKAFSDTGAFYRNRWWDTDSVPRADYKAKNVLTKQVWKPAEVPFLYKVNSKSRVSNAPYITISSIRKEFQDERDANGRVVKSLKAVRKQMAKRGDFSYKQTVLLQRVPDISTPGFMGTQDFYYAPVHAYGDAQRAQEYYSDNTKPSVLNNNVYNPGKEYSVEKIADAFYKWKGQNREQKEETLTENIETKDQSKKLQMKKGPCK